MFGRHATVPGLALLDQLRAFLDDWRTGRFVSTLGWLAAGLVLSVASGALLVVGLGQPLLGDSARDSAVPAAAMVATLSPATTVTRQGPLPGVPPQARATPVPPDQLTLDLAVLDAKPVAQLAAVSTPIPAAVAPATVAQPAELAPPGPQPAPPADVAWETVSGQLDVLWGVDTPRCIALLTDFRAQYPEFGPASEKLYASYLAQAATLIVQGDNEQAVAQVSLAQAVEPGQPEAKALLAELTATP